MCEVELGERMGAWQEGREQFVGYGEAAAAQPQGAQLRPAARAAAREQAAERGCAELLVVRQVEQLQLTRCVRERLEAAVAQPTATRGEATKAADQVTR